MIKQVFFVGEIINLAFYNYGDSQLMFKIHQTSIADQESRTKYQKIIITMTSSIEIIKTQKCDVSFIFKVSEPKQYVLLTIYK
jgi:hypothetical protein